MWIVIPVAIFILFGVTALTGAPYVPSKKRELKTAFEKLYQLKEQDFLVDLGSGDGVVLAMASKYKAKGLGIELNPLMLIISKWRLRKCKSIKFKWGSFWKAKLPAEATVFYVFADSRDIRKVYRLIEHRAKELNKKFYLISYAFKIPEVEAMKHVGAYYLYLIG